MVLEFGFEYDDFPHDYASAAHELVQRARSTLIGGAGVALSSDTMNLVGLLLGDKAQAYGFSEPPSH